MDSFEKLKIADETLVRISGIIFNFDIVSPKNIDEEWNKFKISNYNYSPQLEYNSFDVQKYIDELKKLDIPRNSPTGKLFNELRDKVLSYSYELLNVGTPDFNTEKYFESVSEEIIMKAHNIIDMKLPKIKLANKTISSEELAKIIKQELDKYNIKDWIIKFRKNSSSPVAINAGAKKIIINKNGFYSEYRVNKLLIHEMGTHVLRAENGDKQEFKIFRVGVPGYDVTEEGLAGFNEREQGFKSKQIMMRYALRVIATKVASVGGFMDVFNSIRPFVDNDYQAFKIAIRTKRGLSDTSKKGGLLKDHIYLKGMFLIEDFVKNGGDIKQLYAGKIRVEDIHLIDEGIIKPASILPEFLK